MRACGRLASRDLVELASSEIDPMSGHHPFSELLDRMSPERRKRSEEAARRMLRKLKIVKLRQARERARGDSGPTKPRPKTSKPG
jgi:hypothetical protein